MKTFLAIVGSGCVVYAVFCFFIAPKKNLLATSEYTGTAGSGAPISAVKSAADAAIGEVFAPLSAKIDSAAVDRFELEIRKVDSQRYGSKKEAALDLAAALRQAGRIKVEYVIKLQNNDRVTKPSALEQGKTTRDVASRREFFADATKKQWDKRAEPLRSQCEKYRLMLND